MDPIVSSYQALGIGLSKVGADPDLLAFHGKAQAVISGETKRASDAARSLDPGLQPAVRKARLKAAFAVSRARMESKLTGLVENTFGSRLRAAKTNLNKAQALPTDPLEALRFEARVGEARRQIEALSGSERYQALKTMADKADARLLPVLRDSVVPLVQPDVAEALESAYLAAFAGPESAYLQATADAIQEATDVSKIAYVALGASASAMGIPMSELRSASPKDVVQGLAPSISAVLVARFGPTVLDDLSSGKRPMTDLFDLL